MPDIKTFCRVCEPACGLVATAAELREPHRVARYLEEKVAKSAQRFWDDCQVLPKGDEEVADTTAPRLLLWRATRIVLITKRDRFMHNSWLHGSHH